VLDGRRLAPVCGGSGGLAIPRRAEASRNNFVAVPARRRQTLAEGKLSREWSPINARLSIAPTTRYNERARLSKLCVYDPICFEVSTYDFIILSTYYAVIVSAY
jgi:hypothetical protein